LKLIELMEKEGAVCDIHDPFIPVVPPIREHPRLVGRETLPLNVKMVAAYDVVLIATDHDDVDYKMLVKAAKLVVDTRDACARAGVAGPNVAKA
jgi:UDP-N-acetyl-D-glucosamine dehydrogenase